MRIFDRPTLFIFVIGGLTEIEVEQIVSTVLNNEGVNKKNIHVLVGCTHLLRNDIEDDCVGNGIEPQTNILTSTSFLKTFFC